MRSKIEEYNVVVEAARKFTKSVAEGNSNYAESWLNKIEYQMMVNCFQARSPNLPNGCSGKFQQQLSIADLHHILLRIYGTYR